MGGDGRADGPRRIILHVDMDAFYASVEAHERPELADRPLVIGADPRGGDGRGVVSTANYAARRYGIHSAMPISQAYRACPHAVFLRPDFKKYSAASASVMGVLDQYADVLQQVGLDEAYLDVTDACREWARVPAFARSLQAAVRRATGLSCSVGAAPTKSAAKIASDLRKPHGVSVLAPDELLDSLAPLPVHVIPGCGPKMTARLSDQSIHTIRDVHDMTREQASALAGRHGAWVWDVAHGHDPRTVSAERGPGKSRGNERTYGRDTADARQVTKDVLALLDRLMEREDRAFATLTVKLRYEDFTTLTRAKTLPTPLEPDSEATRIAAVETVRSLLAPLLDGRPIRLAGVRLSGFHAPTGQQPLRRYGLRPQRRPACPKGTPNRSHHVMAEATRSRSTSAGTGTRKSPRTVAWPSFAPPGTGTFQTSPSPKSPSWLVLR